MTGSCHSLHSGNGRTTTGSEHSTPKPASEQTTTATFLAGVQWALDQEPSEDEIEEAARLHHDHDFPRKEWGDSHPHHRRAYREMTSMSVNAFLAVRKGDQA